MLKKPQTDCKINTKVWNVQGVRVQWIRLHFHEIFVIAPTKIAILQMGIGFNLNINVISVSMT